MHTRGIVTWSPLVLLFVIAGCQERSPVEEIEFDESAASEAAPPITLADDDWPWWRGPERNGVAGNAHPPTSWTATENVRWKVAIPGRGHSSPTVVGNRIYLATADDSRGTQSVMAINRSDGKRVWTTPVHQGKLIGDGMHHNSTHANSTIACDGTHIYVAFLNRDGVIASALDVDGHTVWQENLGEFDSKFGYAPSPVVHGSLVIFAADHRGSGYLAACHRRSGDIVWRRARPAVATYSSAVVANVAGRDQLLISGCERISSFDPDTGRPLWSSEFAPVATCGTVVWDDNNVFASGGYPASLTLCVSADGSGEPVWSNNHKCYEQSMLVRDGFVYALVDTGVVYCWDAATGSEKWKHRLSGPVSASPVLAGGHIYASNEKGTTFVFESTPDRFRLVAKNRLGDESFASPAVCGDALYLRVAEHDGRNRTEYLYCLADESAQPIADLLAEGAD